MPDGTLRELAAATGRGVAMTIKQSGGLKTVTTTDLARSGARQAIEAIETRTQKGLTLEMVIELTGYEAAQIALVSRTVAKDAPLQELAVFLHACRALQLDPLLRQAYWIRRKNRENVDGQWVDVYKGTLQVGIDGFRAIAERSGAYAGSEPPHFLGQVEVSTKEGAIVAPERAQVVVWKIVQGHKAAFTGEANWIEFYPGDGATGQMYRKMPRHMLAKDAEAQALRKAFPALLGSVQVSSLADGELPSGDLPEVAAPRVAIEETRDDSARSARLAAQQVAIFGSDETGTFYDQPQPKTSPATPPAEQSTREPSGEAAGSRGSAEPRMVTQQGHPLWAAYTAAWAQAEAEGIDVPELALPQPDHVLIASTATLLEMVVTRHED